MNNKEKQSQLQRLFYPETIAVIGGKAAEEVIRQCEYLGFSGEIWPVNPTRSQMCGRPCFASIAELPGMPDAGFVAVPASAAVDIIRQLAEIGCGGAVCYTAGFAEADAQGVQRQQQLVEVAANMPVVGPNCHGVLNAINGLALWPDQHGCSRVSQGVALISQSGNIAINLTMQQRSLSISHVVSIGNSAQMEIHDYIEFLLQDPAVAAIGLHIEELNDIHRFSQVAIAALKKGIPLVALKSGASELGAQVTMSHTRSMAGSDALYNAFFRRLGIARCFTLPQFIETLKLLFVGGALSDNSLGSLSCSGGEASLVADGAAALNIKLPILSPASTVQLGAVLGAGVHLSNPLDYHTFVWGDQAKLRACFSAMLENHYACTMLVLDYPHRDQKYDPLAAASWEITERAFVEAVKHTGQRGVVVATLPESFPAVARQRLLEAGIAPMQGLDDCLFALRAAIQIGHAQKISQQILPVMVVETLAGSVETLNESRSKQALKEYGIQVPAGVCCDHTGTVTAAAQLGFPVALKVLSDTQAHKSETGAVAIGLNNAEAVHEATARMREQGQQFLVEKMLAPVVAELIVGVSRDPTFGLTLLIGAGGVLVEMLKDSVTLLLPVQRDEIQSALQSLRVSPLLNGYRGRSGGDTEALIDAILAVADYAIANNGTLDELDINPLIVMPTGVAAADAFIRKQINPTRMQE